MKSTAHNSPMTFNTSHQLRTREEGGTWQKMWPDLQWREEPQVISTSDQQFSQEEIVCELRGDVVIWFKKRKPN